MRKNILSLQAQGSNPVWIAASPTAPRNDEKAFTLLEMSLVLVIIALIVGGILVGQSLIRASEINSVISDVTRYTQAAVDFRDKYHALPGDFAGATALWGAPAAGCPGGARAGTDPITATCNGDGNGTITNFGVDASYYEAFRAWQHLANAGLIDGAYSGVSGAGSQLNTIIGVNVPASKLPGGGYTLMYTSYNRPNGMPGQMGHVLNFGAVHPDTYTWDAILTVDEARAIDTKMDDGIAGTGTVQATALNCTNILSVPAVYNTGYKGAACGLIFVTGF